ncbi:hypothetical protein ZWY2020_057163 [Hordeum vulgare]|nr:hypothetical protein ZWY2020_057163 [Hordeum vulgare]
MGSPPAGRGFGLVGGRFWALPDDDDDLQNAPAASPTPSDIVCESILVGYSEEQLAESIDGGPSTIQKESVRLRRGKGGVPTSAAKRVNKEGLPMRMRLDNATVVVGRRRSHNGAERCTGQSLGGRALSGIRAPTGIGTGRTAVARGGEHDVGQGRARWHCVVGSVSAEKTQC